MAKVKRTKSIVRAELREVEKRLERPDEFATDITQVTLSPVELIQKKTLLKHELKQFDVKAATGKNAGMIKKLWKRRREAEERIAVIKKREDEANIKEAKKRFKGDKQMQKEAAEELSVEELEALLKKKKKK